MGFYIKCKFCGKEEKGFEPCDCGSNITIKTVEKMKNKILIDIFFFNEGFGQNVYMKFLDDDKEFYILQFDIAHCGDRGVVPFIQEITYDKYNEGKCKYHEMSSVNINEL